jgi:hypothetical protein
VSSSSLGRCVVMVPERMLPKTHAWLRCQFYLNEQDGKEERLPVHVAIRCPDCGCGWRVSKSEDIPMYCETVH